MKIIHLADCHIESGRPDYKRDTLINALLQDLDKFVDEDTVLVITGDLIDKGGVGFDKDTEIPYKKFKELFIDKIISKYPSLIGKLFLVPGNHDIDRGKIDAIKHNGLLCTFDQNYEELNNFISKNNNHSEYLEQLEQYKLFEKSLYQDDKDYKWSFFESTKKLQLSGINVGIACFNSSWLCRDDNDFGMIALGQSQIEQALHEFENTTFKIALIHHPIDFMRQIDQEHIKSLLHNNFDLILTGHTHKIESGHHQTLEGNVLISVSESIISSGILEDGYTTGYSIVEVFPGKKYEISFRKFLPKHGKFVPNTDIGQEDGKKKFLIPSQEEQILDTKIRQIIKNIKSSHLEEINNDLIIYNADENIPNTIDDIFVAPTLCNFLENHSQAGEGIVEYEINDILSSDENYIIFGPKESGKTIFLDKVLIDSITHFTKHKKIPILIRFQDIGNRDILQIVRSFLSLNRDELNEIYEKNKFLLLIDNINFTKNGTEKTTDFYNLNKIYKFKKEYPNIQIIGTSIQEFENLIPDGYLQCNHKFEFNAAFIHSLKTTQIRSLIKKWFYKKEIDFQENLEKLLNNFRQLGLPRTPLSVTMFLWIINKQEKEPVNNAVLVEIFIENLLEKANFDNAFSNSFDFHNKVRLLTYLSKYMLDNGRFESSYSISYIEALQFIQKYLEKKYGDPKAILNNLIERRILSYTNDNYVRFKSSFFFHFFLAHYIDRDPEFKKLVFDNCLEFSEELELYSGLKRDSVEVLDLVVSKLAESFKPFNDTILPQFTKIDSFLETKDSLSKHIDLDKAQKKPDEKVIDQAYDETLNNLPVKKDIPLKKLNEQSTIFLDKLLKLASVVLKNSEEIDNFEKRFSSYEIILQSSISFFVMYRQHLLNYFETHKKKPNFFPKNIDFNMFIRFLPLIHQVVLFDWLGSIKMSPLLIEKIRKDKQNKYISEFEKFLSVFIFSDMNGENFKKHIDNFFKNTDKKYLLDSAFLKILTYYYLRSKSDDLDEYYLNLLANIQEKLGKTNAKRKTLLKMTIKKNKKEI